MVNKWIEVPVFIHGVDPSANPKEHSKSYSQIVKLINEELKKIGKRQFDAKPIAVEWGWNFKNSIEDDRFLSEAQRIISENIDNSLKNKKFYFFEGLFKRFHTKLRKELLFGGGDMFYYISKDGEASVRNTVFNQIAKDIMKKQNKNISLTFLTHSAGTVVMHDLLYHIFGRKGDSPVKSVNEIRKLARNGKLRIRKIFTFGSPLTSTSLRSNTLLLNIIKKKKLNPEDIGLLKKDNISNPRWVNFWDQGDIISFPLEFSYKQVGGEKIVQDELINLRGFLFWKVHSEYWKSRKMARKIAEVF